ncbi:hypothetical protein DM01DRAFT_1340054 [Hesseltinella vesiculosa]|uniref:Uncharacterized protein n=1 Tax=Hesseltinella vesiculosa TaxID=101127 RepID=A0A1X2G5H7_9FUNG|nr:hypothetical protein DM01DRAFT_1340054 [Hesseltinella vesiculosa]
MTFDTPSGGHPAFHAQMNGPPALFPHGLGWPPSHLNPSAMDLPPSSMEGLTAMQSPPTPLTTTAPGMMLKQDPMDPVNTAVMAHPPQVQQKSKPTRKSKSLSSSSSTSSANPIPNNNVSATSQHGAYQQPPIDMTKPYHSEWGVMKDRDFHPLTLKHQRDLENIYTSGKVLSDFYFWQANLGGYCMADMIQNVVVSSEGAYPLIRRIVEGAPHPGRRKKKQSES